MTSSKPVSLSSTTRPRQSVLSAAIRPRWRQLRQHRLVVVEVAALVGVDEDEVEGAGEALERLERRPEHHLDAIGVRAGGDRAAGDLGVLLVQLERDDLAAGRQPLGHRAAPSSRRRRRSRAPNGPRVRRPETRAGARPSAPTASAGLRACGRSLAPAPRAEASWASSSARRRRGPLPESAASPESTPHLAGSRGRACSSRRSSTGSRNSTCSSTMRACSICSTPRSRNQSQTPSTSRSGAEAPEVMPTVSTPSSQFSSIAAGVLDQVRLDPAGPGHVDQPVGVGAVLASRSRAAAGSAAASP